MKYRHLIAFIITVIASISCKAKFGADQWYSNIRDCIIEDSNLSIDSISNILIDGTISQRFYFNKGKLFMMHYFREDTFKIAAEFKYSRNGDWQLRKEFHLSGPLAFEGICFKEQFFGKSTWYFPSGRPREQGIRIKSENVGIWNFFNEDGSIEKSYDYNQAERIDTLFKLKSCH